MYSYPFIVLEVDDLLMSTIMQILQGDGVSDECIDFMVHLTCLTWPPCSPETGLPLDFCEETCEVYQWIRATEFCKDVEDSLLRFIMGSEIFETFDDRFENFDCTSNYSEYDPDMCTNLFSPEVQGQ